MPICSKSLAISHAKSINNSCNHLLPKISTVFTHEYENMYWADMECITGGKKRFLHSFDGDRLVSAWEVAYLSCSLLIFFSLAEIV